MMILNPFAGLFKGKNKNDAAKPHPPEQTPEVKPDTKADANADTSIYAPVPVQELLTSLEHTTVALSKSGLSDGNIAEHAKSLNEMKEEITGLGEIRAIPELSSALAQLFEKSLIKVFQYGDDAQIMAVKDVIFKAIDALSQIDALKNQRLATIDVYESAIKGEIWATDHLISERKAEYKEFGIHNHVEDEFDKPEFMVKLAALITNLMNQNKASQEQLNSLSIKRTLIETDESGKATKEVLLQTAEYLAKLPSSVEEILKTAREIEERRKQIIAENRYEAKVLMQGIKGVDEEMAALDAEMRGESAKAQKAPEQAVKGTAEQDTSSQRVTLSSH